MIVTREEYSLDISCSQTVPIRQIVKCHGIEMQDGIPTLVMDVVDESELQPRLLLSFRPGHPAAEDPGQFLGTIVMGKFVRDVYLAD